ncbi:MAG: hypothetical protein WC760_11700 [Bacteroidia bacterium]|jgi:hypothetical protein
MKFFLLACSLFLLVLGLNAQHLKENKEKPFDLKNYFHLMDKDLTEVLKELNISASDTAGLMKQIQFPQVKPFVVYQVLPLLDGTWLAFEGTKLAIIVPPKKP